MRGEEEKAMDREAFSDLVSAYGAEPRRWPEDRRVAALAYARTEDGKRLLAGAAEIDHALSAYRLYNVPSGLSAKILAGASGQITRRRRFVRYGLSAGMIGISLAGALTGAIAAISLTPPPVLTLGDTLTAFGTLQNEHELSKETE